MKRKQEIGFLEAAVEQLRGAVSALKHGRAGTYIRKLETTLGFLQAVRSRSSNSDREVRAHLGAALAYLAEAHEDEIATNHHEDGPEGCSYCECIREGRVLLQEVADRGAPSEW